MEGKSLYEAVEEVAKCPVCEGIGKYPGPYMCFQCRAMGAVFTTKGVTEAIKAACEGVGFEEAIQKLRG